MKIARGFQHDMYKFAVIEDPPEITPPPPHVFDLTFVVKAPVPIENNW